MVAAKLANIGHGENQHTLGAANLSVQPVKQSTAADMLNVYERTVRNARSVIDDATPELMQAVECGAVSVSAAAKVATLPTPEPIKIVARGEPEILHAAKEIRAARVWPA